MKYSFPKRVLTLVLLLCLLVGTALPAGAVTYNGIANNGSNGITIDIYSHPFSTYANKSWGQYAYGPSGCAWFASARACQLTGIDTPIWSGSSWYNSAYANYGYTRGSTPRAKALACWEGHVSVVEAVNGDSIVISEGGYQPASNNDYTIIQTMSRSQVESARNGAFLGYVYLGVGSNTSSVELGTDFYAYIHNGPSNLVLTSNTPNGAVWGNVNAQPYQATKRQLWKFVRNSDGSYTIFSTYGGGCLDVGDAVTSNGANLTVNNSSGHAAQRFYITEGPSGYVFRTALCSTVIDIDSSVTPTNGTNVQMWTYGNGIYQQFNIFKVANNYPPLASYGDINFDGSVNASDALMALQHSVQLITLDYTYNETADVSADNQINASDALMILQKSVGLLGVFPAKQ